MEDNNDIFGSRHFSKHHRHHGWFGAMQAQRGDMKPIILNVLAEKPMHGYEIIRQLEEKSEGLWRPSPGSVYPTLQLLEDEDLVTSVEENGKKVYTITEKGMDEAKKTPIKNPWEKWDKGDIKKFIKVRVAAKQILPALMKINESEDDEKIERAMKIIQDTAEKLQKLSDTE